jgi:lysozyme
VRGISVMQYSKSGETLTESFEGCRLSSYQDQVGVWTIGYGHTRGVGPGMLCTPAQAEAWLIEDIQWASDTVNKYVTVVITQGEFDALVDFTFNLGANNFWHSTLLKLVNKGDFTAAANEFAKWDRAGGKVVAGLLRRREAEEAEFNG